MLAEVGLPVSIEGSGKRFLVDGPSRHAEIATLTVRVTKPVESVAQKPIDLGGVRGLGVVEVRKFCTDRRSDRRLMRSAFRSEGDAGRRSDDDKAGAVVEAVNERIETAQDKGVVYGSDGKEVLVMVIVAETELSEEHEQIHLTDPQLDVLARRRRGPFEQPINASVIVLLGG